MTNITTKAILKAIGCPALSLHRINGQGYCVFTYDTLDAGGTYATKSVYVSFLSQLPLSEWVKEGQDFIKEIGA